VARGPTSGLSAEVRVRKVQAVTPPEPLHTCGVVVRHCDRTEVLLGIRLASCPGLAAAAVAPGSWVVVHDALAVTGQDAPSQGARKLTPEGIVAPWAEALRYMLAVTATGIDWMQPAPQVRRADMPPLGDGWVPLERVEPRRAA